jgi:signal transduction histidine kinase
MVLAGIAALIVLITMWFTHQLADTIGKEERRRVEIYAAAIESITKGLSDTERDYSFEQTIIKNNTTIPMVWTDSLHTFFDAVNFGDDKDTCRAFMLPRIAELRAQDRFIPIITELNPIQYVYYDESQILKWLKWVPYGQLALVIAFVLFGYLSFSAARKAEQNQIWIGLAKETAHQLGTPISGILGWLELLQLYSADTPELAGVADEIRNDVSRLELVADRFSKIGAKPQLEERNVVEHIERNFEYFKSRAPRKVSFTYPTAENHEEHIAYISPMLIDWVFENLLKNALDAMETGQGSIEAICFEDENWVFVDVKDTGKGIPLNKHQSIFEPGFTTKKRGWGLGLSLARRIVQDYHGGRIFVKKSEVGAGTTFRVQFPKKYTIEVEPEN